MENQKLYIKIAHWYYTLKLTQEEIAKRLSLTRQRVNQIINLLAPMGVVSITVNGFEDRNVFLENYLEEKYKLKQAIVTNVYSDESPAAMFREVTEAAARHFEHIVQPKSIVGVSWGRTLAATIGWLNYRKKPDCKVVQLLGVQNMIDTAVKTDEIARALADKLDCPSHMLYAPVVVDHPETKTMLMREKSIKKSFELMRTCDIALVGIGEVSEASTICQRGILSEEDIRQLQEGGFCADICINPLRADGTWHGSCVADRVIGADMELLQKIPNVVGIVTGNEKTRAVAAALKSGCVNTLILDQVMADALYRLRDEAGS